MHTALGMLGTVNFTHFTLTLSKTYSTLINALQIRSCIVQCKATLNCPGEVILVEEPLSWSVNVRSFPTVCQWCGREVRGNKRGRRRRVDGEGGEGA